MAGKTAQRRSPKTPRRRRNAGPSSPGGGGKSPPTPWWGEGAPPWQRWPGASIKIDAVWSDERGRWESPCGRFYYDELRAMRPARFFRGYLRQSKGEWGKEPLELLPWQDLLIFRPLFGWLRVEDGLRRFRNVICFVPKKNGKSTIASGLALYLLAGDGEPGAEVYSAAADEGQARIVFDEAAAMANQSTELRGDLGIEVLKRAITVGKTNSKYQVVTSKASTKHGFNVHGLVMDELHTQRTRDLLDTLYKGAGARRQPVIFKISTAGDDRTSICYEEYEYAKRVMSSGEDHIDDPKCLPIVFELAPNEEWWDPKAWARCNPSLGVAKKLDYMQGECVAAQAMTSKRNSFLRLELNVWTESRTVWIAPEQWAECVAKPALPMTGLEDLTCTAGVDLSSSCDLTCVALTFRRPDASRPPTIVVVADGAEPDAAAPSPASPPPARKLVLDYTVDVVPYFFIPRGVMQERIRKDRVKYDEWARDGWIRVTDGDVVDFGYVYNVILDEIQQRFKGLVEVGFDPWNATHLSTSLQSAGVPMTMVRQGAKSLSPAAKLFEALVRSKRIRHDGNPVMSWCVGNCEIEVDTNDNIRPVKVGGESRGTRRIDGVVATLTSLSRLMVIEEGGPSVYETRGVLVL